MNVENNVPGPFMKNYLYTLAFVIAIVLWCTSFYLLISRHPYAAGIHIPSHGAHTVMFFGLAFMTICSQRRPKIVLTLAALYCFGGMTEIAQHFSPPRTCDLLDFIEDVTGSTVGLFAAMAWMALLRFFLRYAFGPQTAGGNVVPSRVS